MNDIKNVCVYSASSTKIAKEYFDAAEKLGRLLAEKRINLINGAGCIGLMAATSDAALAAGGTVTGVIPHFMVEQGWHHTGLTQLVEVESMHQRKKTMADLSDAAHRPARWLRHPGRTAGNHHLEATRTVSEPDCDTECQELFRPSARYAPAGGGRKLHAYAARCHLACGADTAGSRGTDIYHSLVGRLHP